MVPVLLLPDASITVAPDDSSKAYAAARVPVAGGGGVACVVALAVTEYKDRLPAASLALTRYV
jgi:hypothetical protein